MEAKFTSDVDVSFFVQNKDVLTHSRHVNGYFFVKLSFMLKQF